MTLQSWLFCSWKSLATWQVSKSTSAIQKLSQLYRKTKTPTSSHLCDPQCNQLMELQRAHIFLCILSLDRKRLLAAPCQKFSRRWWAALQIELLENYYKYLKLKKKCFTNNWKVHAAHKKSANGLNFLIQMRKQLNNIHLKWMRVQ